MQRNSFTNIRILLYFNHIGFMNVTYCTLSSIVLQFINVNNQTTNIMLQFKICSYESN